MARYSDIKRGGQLNDQFIKYKDWLDDTVEQRSASYAAVKAKTADAEWERQICFVLPYQSDSTTMFLEAKRLTTAQASATLSKESAVLAAEIGADFTVAQVPALGESIRLPGFKFARFSATERSGTPADRTSRISGKKYKQYQTISASTPIGRTTAQGTFGSARAFILGKGTVEAFLAKLGYRISIIPERG